MPEPGSSAGVSDVEDAKAEVKRLVGKLGDVEKELKDLMNKKEELSRKDAKIGNLRAKLTVEDLDRIMPLSSWREEKWTKADCTEPFARLKNKFDELKAELDTEIAELKDEKKSLNNQLESARGTLKAEKEKELVEAQKQAGSIEVRPSSFPGSMSGLSSAAPLAPDEIEELLAKERIEFKGSEIKHYSKKKGANAEESMYLVMKAAKLALANHEDNKLELGIEPTPEDSASNVGVSSVTTISEALEGTEYTVIDVNDSHLWTHAYEGVIADGEKEVVVSCTCRPDYVIVLNRGDVRMSQSTGPKAFPELQFAIVEIESSKKGLEYGKMQLTFELLAIQQRALSKQPLWGFFISNDKNVHVELLTQDGGVYYEVGSHPLSSLPRLCSHLFTSGMKYYSTRLTLKHPKTVAVPGKKGVLEFTPAKRKRSESGSGSETDPSPKLPPSLDTL